MSLRYALFVRAVAVAVLVTAGAAYPAMSHAGAIFNDWNYAIDSQSDGSGAAEGFEMRGLAFRELNGTAYFAVSSGMPLGGIPWGGTLNNRISYGDLFLNFSSHNLTTPGYFNDSQVVAIRFDSSNDSLNNVGGSNSGLGLFASVTPVGLMLQNSGYGSLQQYYNYGFGAASGAMGDLSTTSDVISYLGNGAMYPNIGSGTKIGEISLLNGAALSSLGLDFGHFGADPSGNQIFGFAVNSGLLPGGAFTAHLFYECINDGVALYGRTVPDNTTTASAVPEPDSMTLALAGMGTLLCYQGWARRRNRLAVGA